jgi:dTDP-4-amino-4,6-dideoxygalactose transaminase
MAHSSRGGDAQQMHLTGAGAVASLENKLAAHYGMRYALCVSNATTALLSLAIALGLKRDEFVTTPYTYGGSLAGWLLLGNRPVFADIEPGVLTLDARAVRAAVTPRTKAILAVDIFGHPSDTEALRAVADDYGLWYVADSAQSLGASRNCKPSSYLADVLVVSFTAGKTLSAGEGGALLTNDGALYQKLVWWTQHPNRQRRDLGLWLSNEFALNARIHPLAAVWADTLFEDTILRLKIRQQACFEIIDALNNSGLTQPIDFAERNIRPSFFRLTSMWKRATRGDRLIATLHDHGYTVRLEKPPVELVYRQAAFLAQYGRRYRLPRPCDEAERQARRRFCLRLGGGHDRAVGVVDA